MAGPFQPRPHDDAAPAPAAESPLERARPADVAADDLQVTQQPAKDETPSTPSSTGASASPQSPPKTSFLITGTIRWDEPIGELVNPPAGWQIRVVNVGQNYDKRFDALPGTFTLDPDGHALTYRVHAHLIANLFQNTILGCTCLPGAIAPSPPEGQEIRARPVDLPDGATVVTSPNGLDEVALALPDPRATEVHQDFEAYLTSTPPA